MITRQGFSKNKNNGVFIKIKSIVGILIFRIFGFLKRARWNRFFSPARFLNHFLFVFGALGYPERLKKNEKGCFWGQC